MGDLLEKLQVVVYLANVSSDSTEIEGSAVQLIMTTLPPDDAGARTADLYDWQASMAAADGLEFYRTALTAGEDLSDAGARRLLCEYHEDWVAILGDDAELVSAKHKEPSFGAYTTINQLRGDGGLGHLFSRWLALGEKPACRLVTTAGLAAGPPQELGKAVLILRNQRLDGKPLVVAGAPGEAVSQFARTLLSNTDSLPAHWKMTGGGRNAGPTAQQREQVARFLSILTLQCGRPSRVHIAYAAPGMYAKPVLAQLGYPDTPPEAVWEAVLGIVRSRMRAAGPRPEGGLEPVLAHTSTVSALGTALDSDFADRIVTLGDIDVAVRTAVALPGGFMPLPTLIRTSRLAVKMAAGHCGDNSIERAEQLKLDFRNYWRARASGDPAAGMERERLMRALHRLSDQAAAATESHDRPWGADFWVEVQTQIEALLASEGRDDLDLDLLLGGICELASRCKVWFSKGFDVQAAIAQARARQRAAS
ncbi:hypothetical protein ABZ806_27900 [Spirillospora sp. NPDC047418]